MKKETKNSILAIVTSLPIILGLITPPSLAVSIVILTIFIPLSAYYIGLVLMARAKTKKDEKERTKVTFTGY
ncbi:MAG TPA: hypothetical protein GXX31_00935 [Methanothermobacter sp.]|jgi:hypothetical protein|uniref:Uncharacterized protein n=1 Tax=Methanothermobacter tenebrarum TaxID=680118 RepID=A0ABN6PGS0_9EURY|nr:hypothetical protein [Methanothermobacter tenebrarum]MDD3453936.1 hypothetical protein [Methanobacteriales archaeon]MDI6882177.1 hypothetical protein [Methanothermobacter sp.]MDX9692755.1 hypothetical protein [Methanothermobacter sp.]BDH80102.1 hypothetical protein MTTB_14810 [Methanothermobacter tenebrarum]HHW15939.1 hypothetical protein [Methanothermobacter sp.]